MFTDAMKKVEEDMQVFGARRGENPENLSFGGGLSGFTKTLLHAITRLISYVNEVCFVYLFIAKF